MTNTPIETKCPTCGTPYRGGLLAHKDPGGGPQPGTFCICSHCSSVAVFDNDLRLRPLSEKEKKLVENNSAIQSHLFALQFSRPTLDVAGPALAAYEKEAGDKVTLPDAFLAAISPLVCRDGLFPHVGIARLRGEERLDCFCIPIPDGDMAMRSFLERIANGYFTEALFGIDCDGPADLTGLPCSEFFGLYHWTEGRGWRFGVLPYESEPFRPAPISWDRSLITEAMKMEINSFTHPESGTMLHYDGVHNANPTKSTLQ